MRLGLKGRRAIVTGGSRGIGMATAAALAEEGVAVATCARGGEGLDKAVDQLQRGGGQARGWVVDVSDRPSYLRWLDEALDWLGGVDIFVANVSATTPVEDPEGSWSRYFETDLMHGVRGVERLVEPLASSPSGSVVLVSSASALVNLGHGENGEGYSAMKAALISYAAQKARQLGARGVRVNTVTPGTIYFDGGVWDAVRQSDPQMFADVEGRSALGRMGTPEEVASAVVFLVSDAASLVTGANLRVDGGLLEAVDF